MATIPNQATGLRHVRKTIAFDGTANNGNLGDDIDVFTATGSVRVVEVSWRCTENLACTAPTLTGLRMLSGAIPIGAATLVDGAVAGKWFHGGLEAWAAVGHNVFDPTSTSSNLVLAVSDDGGGADVTDGTIVFDVWYYPITDDGALAGDDIDTELGAYLADKVLDEALSGHTTAGSLGKAVADVEVDTSTTLQGELDGIQADTEDIQSRLPAALVGGRIDATIDATGMEPEAIDAILTRQMTEAYAADGAAPTLAQALFEIMQCLTEFAISGTTITVKKRDGSTTAMTFTLDSATIPTSRTRAT